MAVPAWAMDSTHTDVYINGAGNFTAFGGGPAGLNTETDYYILDGSGGGTPSCQSKNAWAGALRGFMHDEAGTDLAVGTDGVLMAWTIYHVPNAITARSASAEQGLSIRVGTSTTVNWYFTVGGGSELLFETWVPWVVQWDNLTSSTFQGTNGTPSAGGTVDWVGASWDVNSNGPTKGSPAGIDGIRYGRMSLEYTAGEAADYQTFAKAEAYANAETRRWGVIEERSGVFFVQGFHSLGVTGTAVDFRDSDRQIFIRDTEFATAGFNRFEVINASSNVDWDNILITSLGTQSPGTFVVTSGAFDANLCQFTGMGEFTFLDSSSATECTFTSCDQITAPGTDLSGSSVLTPSVATGEGAVIWDVNQDPDGELDDMNFTMGSNSHAAIELGTNTPASITLRGWAVSGFSGANGNNDSVIYNNSGKAITVNVVGASGTISYRNGTSATTSIVTDPVTIAIHVQDISTQADISGAQAFVTIASAAGGWPYQESVTITRSGTTATVTHATHGLTTNDYVFIEGATDGYYVGCYQITVTTASEYEYTMNGTPAADASGTITSTFSPVMGATDVNGDINASYSYSANQPITGQVRYLDYRTGVISGEIDNAAGRTITLNLVPD